MSHDAHDLALIRGQVRRASQIISALRTFGRAAGTEKGPVNVHDIIMTALRLMGEQLRLNNVTVDLKLTEEPSGAGYTIRGWALHRKP